MKSKYGDIKIVGQNYSVEQLLADLDTCELPVGLDCETEGIDPRKEAPASGKGRIVCWSLSLATKTFLKKETYCGNQIFLSAEHLEPLRWWLSSQKPKVGHNITGFDWQMFMTGGIEVGGIVADTLVCSRLCNNRPGVKHGLKDLMKYRLHYEPIGEFKTLFRERARTTQCRESIRRSTRDGVPTLLGLEWTELAGYRAVPLSEIGPDHRLFPTLVSYATLDAKATVELWLNHFKPELERTKYL